MRAVIIPRLEGGSIGPRTESLVNRDGPMDMVPCLHQGNNIKRKLRVWRDQKCIWLVRAITPLNCAGRHNTPFRGRQYRTQTESLVNLNGPMAMILYLHQGNIYTKKEATGMERTEMYSVSRCNDPT